MRTLTSTQVARIEVQTVSTERRKKVVASEVLVVTGLVS